MAKISKICYNQTNFYIAIKHLLSVNYFLWQKNTNLYPNLKTMSK
jgi:hypothetical protein